MKKERWSAKEKEFLVSNYYNYSIEELASKLNRSKSSVGSKAYVLLIKEGSRKKRDWTEKDVNILLEKYQSFTYKELAELLNKSESSIYRKLKDLGLSGTKCAGWTEKDDLFLELNWGVKSVSWIAKELGRSPGAIRRRGYDKEFGGMYKTGYYLSISEISLILNVEPSTVYNWVRTKKLKSIARTFDKKRGIFVKFETFYEFLKNNQKLWDATKLDHMVLNKEEEWLRKKRREDNNKLKRKSNTAWTRKEEEMLINMISKNKSLDDIVKSINRTKDSISSKRTRLRKENRI